MKVKTLVDGFDGKETYKAGAILVGNNDHVHRLLMSGAAEPIDAEAKKYAEARDAMSHKQLKENKHFSKEIAASVSTSETVKVKKTKKVKRKTKSSW